MGFLFRLYIKALLDGRPLVVVPTGIVAVALGYEPFVRAFNSRDPLAIGLAVCTVLAVVVVLAVAIVDRRANTPRRPKGPQGSKTRR